LRELVADTLLIFASTLLLEPDLWEDLRINYCIADAFRNNGLRDWLNKLASECQKYVLKLIRRILEIL
jgi:hypothetical protein